MPAVTLGISKPQQPAQPLIVMFAAPGPLIVTGSLRLGKDDVWLIVPVSPGWKAMVSGPAAAFASIIAWRSEPTPASLRLITLNVAACARCEVGRTRRTASAARMIKGIARIGASID